MCMILELSMKNIKLLCKSKNLRILIVCSLTNLIMMVNTVLYAAVHHNMYYSMYY